MKDRRVYPAHEIYWEPKARVISLEPCIVFHSSYSFLGRLSVQVKSGKALRLNKTAAEDLNPHVEINVCDIRRKTEVATRQGGDPTWDNAPLHFDIGIPNPNGGGGGGLVAAPFDSVLEIEVFNNWKKKSSKQSYALVQLGPLLLLTNPTLAVVASVDGVEVATPTQAAKHQAYFELVRDPQGSPGGHVLLQVEFCPPPPNTLAALALASLTATPSGDSLVPRPSMSEPSRSSVSVKGHDFSALHALMYRKREHQLQLQKEQQPFQQPAVGGLHAPLRRASGGVLPRMRSHSLSDVPSISTAIPGPSAAVAVSSVSMIDKDRNKDKKKLAALKKKEKLRLFGGRLQDGVRLSTNGKIPNVCADVIAYLKSTGFGVEVKGLFRVPGNKDQIDRLAAAYEKLEDVELEDPHDAGGLLKLYLRELSEPVIPFAHYQHFLDIAERERQGNSDTYLEGYRILLASIPADNRELLRALCDLLRIVATKQDENMMSVDNLAMVFAPNILRPRVDTPQSLIHDSPKAIHCLTTLIQKFQASFENDKERRKSILTELAAASSASSTNPLLNPALVDPPVLTSTTSTTTTTITVAPDLGTPPTTTSSLPSSPITSPPVSPPPPKRPSSPRPRDMSSPFSPTNATAGPDSPFSPTNTATAPSSPQRPNRPPPLAPVTRNAPSSPPGTEGLKEDHKAAAVDKPIVPPENKAIVPTDSKAVVPTDSKASVGHPSESDAHPVVSLTKHPLPTVVSVDLGRFEMPYGHERASVEDPVEYRPSTTSPIPPRATSGSSSSSASSVATSTGGRPEETLAAPLSDGSSSIEVPVTRLYRSVSRDEAPAPKPRPPVQTQQSVNGVEKSVGQITQPQSAQQPLLTQQPTQQPQQQTQALQTPLIRIHPLGAKKSFDSKALQKDRDSSRDRTDPSQQKEQRDREKERERERERILLQEGIRGQPTSSPALVPSSSTSSSSTSLSSGPASGSGLRLHLPASGGGADISLFRRTSWNIVPAATATVAVTVPSSTSTTVEHGLGAPDNSSAANIGQNPKRPSTTVKFVSPKQRRSVMPGDQELPGLLQTPQLGPRTQSAEVWRGEKEKPDISRNLSYDITLSPPPGAGAAGSGKPVSASPATQQQQQKQMQLAIQEQLQRRQRLSTTSNNREARDPSPSPHLPQTISSPNMASAINAGAANSALYRSASAAGGWANAPASGSGSASASGYGNKPVSALSRSGSSRGSMNRGSTGSRNSSGAKGGQGSSGSVPNSNAAANAAAAAAVSQNIRGTPLPHNAINNFRGPTASSNGGFQNSPAPKVGPQGSQGAQRPSLTSSSSSVSGPSGSSSSGKDPNDDEEWSSEEIRRKFFALKPKVRASFDNFDADRSGAIADTEFKSFAMAFVATFVYADMDVAQALAKGSDFLKTDAGRALEKSMMDEINVNESGAVTWEEFWKYFSRQIPQTKQDFLIFHKFVNFWSQTKLVYVSNTNNNSGSSKSSSLQTGNNPFPSPHPRSAPVKKLETGGKSSFSTDQSVPTAPQPDVPPAPSNPRAQTQTQFSQPSQKQSSKEFPSDPKNISSIRTLN